MQEKNKHSHQGHRQRLREKAISGGIEYWPQHEVLELILTYCIPHRDVNPLAHELIDQFGSLAGVFDAGFDQLRKIKWIGDNSATFLSLLPDFFNRYTASKNTDTVVLDTTQKCVNYFRSQGRVKKFEQFYIFCLNAKKKLIKTSHIDSTMASSVNVTLKDFVGIITGCSCRAVIVMHTHPGGSSQPTQSDVIATQRLMEICKTLGISFDDHIIIADNEYFSFLHSGLYYNLENNIKKGIKPVFKDDIKKNHD